MKEVVYLACGVVREEMDYLLHIGKITGEVHYLDSMLHMVPLKLEEVLKKELAAYTGTDTPLVLVYGDCAYHILDLVQEYRAGRVKAINCAQMLTGKERYRELMKEGCFLLLPEWAARWKEIMQSELGLSAEIARSLMGENRSALVYLDTGLQPVPEEALKECSLYTGLPWRVEKVTLDNLERLLVEAKEALQ